MSQLSESELLRYSRQINLPQLDIAGQRKLKQSGVLLVGAGGLGQTAGLYLAGAGLGRLTVADGDCAELSNLHRQIALNTERLGENKAEILAARMRELNPQVQVDAVSHSLDGEAMRSLLSECDLALDCTDSFASRFALAGAAVATATPIVSAAVIRAEGQVAVFPCDRTGACYGCLYPSDAGEQQPEEEQTCALGGVLGPAVGVVASVQALEAVKYLAGAGQSLAGRLLLFDGWQTEFRTIAMSRDPNCALCGQS